METHASLNSVTDFWASLRFCKELDRLGSLTRNAKAGRQGARHVLHFIFVLPAEHVPESLDLSLR